MNPFGILGLLDQGHKVKVILVHVYLKNPLTQWLNTSCDDWVKSQGHTSGED